MQLSNLKRIIDINPYHPFIAELLERVKSGADSETEENARVIYNMALIQAGFELAEPAAFSNSFYRILKDSFGISRESNKVEIDLSEIEDEEQHE